MVDIKDPEKCGWIKGFDKCEVWLNICFEKLSWMWTSGLLYLYCNQFQTPFLCSIMGLKKEALICTNSLKVSQTLHDLSLMCMMFPKAFCRPKPIHIHKMWLLDVLLKQVSTKTTKSDWWLPLVATCRLWKTVLKYTTKITSNNWHTFCTCEKTLSHYTRRGQ